MTARKDRTREKEIRDAAHKAHMPAACFRVFFTMLDRADFGTATLRAPWQPRSLADLARWAQVSVATVKRALAELEGREWVKRQRDPQCGRGHKTTYTLALGVAWPQPQPKVRKVAHPEPVRGAKVAQDGDRKWLTAARVMPDQSVFGAGRAVRRGKLEEEKPQEPRCAVCLTPLDRVLPASGFRTHPCCDPAERAGEPWAA